MSETLCTLRTKGGGGGRYKETSLWTNSAPASNFNAQTVTLSDGLSNYKYVAIDYCYNTSNTGITSRVIYDVTDFKKAVKDNSTNHTISGLTIEGANNVNYARPVFYISDTSIAFGLSSTLNGSGTYAQGTIPLEILGLNELATGHRLRETILWTNSAPTSSFSGQTVTLSESLSNYDMVRLYWRKTTSDSSEMYIDVNVSDYTSITGNTGSFQIYIGYRHSNGGCGRSVGGSGTTASFGGCYFFASTTAANNANAIPTKVAGLRIS